MHEDLTSYDCIILIITVYPHNINTKLKKEKRKESVQLINWTDRHPGIISQFTINCKLPDMMHVLHTIQWKKATILMNISCMQ